MTWGMTCGRYVRSLPGALELRGGFGLFSGASGSFRGAFGGGGVVPRFGLGGTLETGLSDTG